LLAEARSCKNIVEKNREVCQTKLITLHTVKGVHKHE